MAKDTKIPNFKDLDKIMSDKVIEKDNDRILINVFRR